ncbi:MAG: class I SAM-dependent methyltransferase, partial [Betaproteobacteria bacterium]|nr:class I SAM-dependent methyltransferase [Betaproteobacteria bacterium]
MNLPSVRWMEAGAERRAAWRSEGALNPPARVDVVDDTLTADRAFRLANEGTALLWRGDFQNARQLLNALARRLDQRAAAHGKSPATFDLPLHAETYHRHRMQQAQRARALGRLLVPLGADYTIPLGRAPDVRAACTEAFGAPGVTEPESLISLRELLGLIGAHEWRKKGVEVPALNGRIHPHYAVFAPIRSEYVGLLADAAWPEDGPPQIAFDIGTGTGVWAAVLAKRGIARVLATDLDARALACARENVERLGFTAQVEMLQADLFPSGRADLIVCNPPWLPGKPSSRMEAAIYDP